MFDPIVVASPASCRPTRMDISAPPPAESRRSAQALAGLLCQSSSTPLAEARSERVGCAMDSRRWCARGRRPVAREGLNRARSPSTIASTATSNCSNRRAKAGHGLEMDRNWGPALEPHAHAPHDELRVREHKGSWSLSSRHADGARRWCDRPAASAARPHLTDPCRPSCGERGFGLPGKGHCPSEHPFHCMP